MEYLLPCLYSFVGCVGFCLIFNIKPRKGMLLMACLGGALSWGVYLLFGFLRDDIVQSFAAILAVTAYSEGMARLSKTPATIYLIVGLIPLVPGGGIYYTMEYALSGDTGRFLETGLHTFGIAGALAVGILLVSGCVRLLQAVHRRRPVERK